MKSIRKQKIVKKVFDLAEMANLQISITFFDKQQNTMQEINTSTEFGIEQAYYFKNQNPQLKLSSEVYHKLERKRFPSSNFIEETTAIDFLKGYKQFKDTVMKKAEEQLSHESRSLLI